MGTGAGAPFWSRPSRPAAEGVPQNYSAFRSRQRAGIRKSKDAPSSLSSLAPPPAVSSTSLAASQPTTSSSTAHVF
ncbi:hypothetical protein OC835_008046, partial [Tilletia horrida]